MSASWVKCKDRSTEEQQRGPRCVDEKAVKSQKMKEKSRTEKKPMEGNERGETGVWISFQSKHLVLKRIFEVVGEGPRNTSRFGADAIGVTLMS